MTEDCTIIDCGDYKIAKLRAYRDRPLGYFIGKNPPASYEVTYEDTLLLMEDCLFYVPSFNVVSIPTGKRGVEVTIAKWHDCASLLEALALHSRWINAKEGGKVDGTKEAAKPQR